MKVTMVAVSSVNGFLTAGDDPHIRSWTSDEDFRHFRSLIEVARVIVMGRKTYEAMRGSLNLREGTLRVVLTRRPDRYASETVASQLEFSSEMPSQLVQRLSAAGFDELLLVGGGEVNGAFLAAGLVDEIYLTIEPLLFGIGTPLVNALTPDASYKLVSVEQLNSRGTMLLKYLV